MSCLALTCLAVAARANDATSVAAYMKALHGMGQSPLTNQQLAEPSPAVPAHTMAGGIELSLRDGHRDKVICGSDRTVLITVQDNVVSATLPASPRHEALWIDVGQNIRALFTIQVTASDPNYLRLVAGMRPTTPSLSRKPARRRRTPERLPSHDTWRTPGAATVATP